MPRVTIAVLFALAVTTPGAAQSPPEAPRHHSIGAAAHWALPYPGHARPGVQVTWRHWRSPTLGVGADVRWWRTTDITDLDAPAQQGPAGIQIPAMQGRVDERIASYAAGVGILGRVPAGRLSLIAGAGPGFFVDQRSHDSRINASHNVGSVTRRSLGVQALLEVEVRATRRVTAFAGLRIELREVQHQESSSGYPTAGVRVAF